MINLVLNSNSKIMKTLLALLLSIFIYFGNSISVNGQTTIAPLDPKEKVYDKVSEMPEFPGGEAALMKFLAKNVTYPAAAKQNNVAGKVYVQFIVDHSGIVRNAKVLKGLGSGCDEEVIRVINMMPVWTPGKQDGAAVNVNYVLPVSFALASENKMEQKAK